MMLVLTWKKLIKALKKMNKYLKKISTLLLMCFCCYTYGQDFLVSDTDFEQVVNNNVPFEDDASAIIVVEFWGDFNRKGEFKDWEKLVGVKYYRADISKVPNATSKYKVMSVPHVLIFKDSYVEQEYKAGITLKLSETVEEIQKRIDELLEASKF